MTREETIHKLEYIKKAYQMLIDEKVDSGKLVGKDIIGMWKANTPLDAVYKSMVEALDMAIQALEQQSSDDCISRQAVLDEINRISVTAFDDYNDYSEFFDFIDNLPSITPQPKVGRWEYVQYDNNPNIGNWHCSECRGICTEMHSIEDAYNYCPNCGAKMEVEE